MPLEPGDRALAYPNVIYPESKAYVGGFAVVDVASREEALEWAAKIAVACRCAQEVRAFVLDPTV